MIRGCYSDRFEGEGSLPREKNRILELGKSCQDPSVGLPPPPNLRALEAFLDLGILLGPAYMGPVPKAPAYLHGARLIRTG